MQTNNEQALSAERVAEILAQFNQQEDRRDLIGSSLLARDYLPNLARSLEAIRSALRTLYVEGHTAAEADAADALLKQFAVVTEDAPDPRVVQALAERNALMQRVEEAEKKEKWAQSELMREDAEWVAMTAERDAAVAEAKRLREVLRHADGFIQHREDSAEVCYDWCPKCRTEAALAATPAPEQQGEEANVEQINHMVNRFLQWKLPKDFHPDCGIHFDADAAKKLNPNAHTYEPVGTNLLTAVQAKETVQFMLDGLRSKAAETPAPEQPSCHVCGKQKGQPPERCPGHYAGTASAPEQSTEQEGR